jgi:hypothetical protein
MDTEIVCSDMLSETRLAKLLEQCEFLRKGKFLGETLPRKIVDAQERDALVRFERFDTLTSDTTFSYNECARYTSGRIFHPAFELRWLHDSGGVRVLYIGTEQKIPFLEPRGDLRLEKRKDQQRYYLFGRRVIDDAGEYKVGKPAARGDFAEARIPRLLHYPVDGQRYFVQVIVQEYLDEKTKQVALYRFVDVKEA